MKMEAEDMKSPFEAIKQSDEAGKEWWAFIDIAELRAERQQLMSMKDWKEQLVKFLSINDHDILPDACRQSLYKEFFSEISFKGSYFLCISEKRFSLPSELIHLL